MVPPVKRGELIASLIAAGIIIAATITLLMIPRHKPPESLAQADPPTPAPAATTQIVPVAAMTPATAPASSTAPRLIIKKAVYGDLPNGASVDVTDKVAWLFTHDSPSVEATNDNFTDPAFGIAKKLRVDYTLGAKDGTITVEEGQKLTLPPPNSRLAITKAVYGDLPNGGQIDVTGKVAALITHDSLSVEASNDNFTDPASGIVKSLRIDYTFDGQPKSKTVNENDTLTISATGE